MLEEENRIEEENTEKGDRIDEKNKENKCGRNYRVAEWGCRTKNWQTALVFVIWTDMTFVMKVRCLVVSKKSIDFYFIVYVCVTVYVLVIIFILMCAQFLLQKKCHW